MNTKHVYIFGNPNEATDQSAISLLPELKNLYPNVIFIHADPTDEWLDLTDTDVVIIDTVHGIGSPMLFTDPSMFAKASRTSVHDFDLATELPLLLKIGRIKSVAIIGIPSTLTEQIHHKSLEIIERELRKRGIIC